MHYDCLIIDDEPEMASGTCEYFNLFGVSSHYKLTADDALSFLAENTISLILLALNIGGDDYISKPYSLSVLLAKVKAVLKRYASAKPEGRLRVDTETERMAAAQTDRNHPREKHNRKTRSLCIP